MQKNQYKFVLPAFRMKLIQDHWHQMFVTTEVKGTLEVRLQLSKHTQSNACFCFPTNSLFFSLIHTCMPASSVCNSLVNNKKALIVLPRGRPLFPPLGERHPLHLKWLRPSIRTVPFRGTQTNMRHREKDSVRVCVCGERGGSVCWEWAALSLQRL